MPRSVGVQHARSDESLCGVSCARLQGLGRLMRVGVPLAVIAALSSGAEAQAPKLANGCVVIGAGHRFVVAGGSAYRASRVARGRALAIYLKPTGLGTYMLFDRR